MMKTHVLHDEISPITDGIDVLTMYCGEQCLAMPDGDLIPGDFDFYHVNWAHKASCEPCKHALAGDPSKKAKKAVPA